MVTATLNAASPTTGSHASLSRAAAAARPARVSSARVTDRSVVIVEPPVARRCRPSGPRLVQPLLPRVPGGLAGRLHQQELDLRVHAPELVGGPLLQDRVELRADPQQEALALRQGPTGTGCRR